MSNLTLTLRNGRPIDVNFDMVLSREEDPSKCYMSYDTQVLENAVKAWKEAHGLVGRKYNTHIDSRFEGVVRAYLTLGRDVAIRTGRLTGTFMHASIEAVKRTPDIGIGRLPVTKTQAVEIRVMQSPEEIALALEAKSIGITPHGTMRARFATETERLKPLLLEGLDSQLAAMEARKTYWAGFRAKIGLGGRPVPRS